jgi:hypothetical protein
LAIQNIKNDLVKERDYDVLGARDMSQSVRLMTN